MPKNNNISEYIDNISLKKSFCWGFHPDEVYGVICDLTSMYNKVLAEAYEETEALKRKLEEQDRRPASNGAAYTSTVNAESPAVQSEQQTAANGGNFSFYSTEVQSNESDISCEDTDTNDTNDENDASADKELQRLKRHELLEIIVEYSKENERLKETVSTLSEENAELQKKLEDKTLKIDSAGTLAEASFLVNGVLESAQAAAKQYLDNLQDLSKREEEKCLKKEAEAEEYAAKVISNAQKESDNMHKAAIDKCSAMILIATKRSEAIKKEADEYSASIKSATESRCKEMESETRKKCEEMEKAATATCEAMNSNAAAETERVWAELTTKLEDFYKAHDGLRELLQAAGQIPKF